MIRRQPLALSADRWTPYAATLRFRGLDLAGAAFAMQVRQYPDQPGAPLIALGTVSTGAAEGVRLIGVETVDGKPVSTLGLRINETTIESVFAPGSGALPIGGDLTLAWDLHVTPAGGLKQRYLEGLFIIRAGVTQ